MMPSKSTQEIMKDAIEQAHRLANEQVQDFVCLVDSSSIHWCPPDSHKLIPLRLSEKQMADFLAAHDEARQHLIALRIESDVLEPCKVFFNKDTETFSDEELRKNPYAFFYDPTTQEMRLVRVDIFRRETDIPVADALRAWVVSQYSKPQHEKLTTAQFLQALRPWLCGLSLPSAKPLQAELCATAEKALQNQLSMHNAEKSAEQNPPKKLDLTQYHKIASIFGETRQQDSPSKVIEPKPIDVAERAFFAAVQNDSEGNIPPAPPYPFGR